MDGVFVLFPFFLLPFFPLDPETHKPQNFIKKENRERKRIPKSANVAPPSPKTCHFKRDGKKANWSRETSFLACIFKSLILEERRKNHKICISIERRR